MLHIRPQPRVLISFTYIFRISLVVDRYWLVVAQEKYILLCYKQPVSIYKGKSNNGLKMHQSVSSWAQDKFTLYSVKYLCLCWANHHYKDLLCAKLGTSCLESHDDWHWFFSQYHFLDNLHSYWFINQLLFPHNYGLFLVIQCFCDCDGNSDFQSVTDMCRSMQEAICLLT